MYHKQGTILSTLCILTIQSLQQHSEEDIIIHIFQMKKLIHREIKKLAKGHQAVGGRAWVIPTQSWVLKNCSYFSTLYSAS